MTGARDSVIGVRREQALESFRTQMPMRFDTADENPWVNAVLIEAATGRAGGVDRAAACDALTSRASSRATSASITSSRRFAERHGRERHVVAGDQVEVAVGEPDQRRRDRGGGARRQRVHPPRPARPPRAGRARA